MAVSLLKFNADNDAALARFFLPYQVKWIRERSRLCLAEKSVRIGWTFTDAFRNVLKRLRHPRRDYLFTTKDEATAFEYVKTCRQHCEVFDLTRYLISSSSRILKTPEFSDDRLPPGVTEFKAGVLTFDNHSRIIAFSSNPNALRAFGGDVGIDEFAFHADPETLWATAAGRATWGYDIALWSSHNGEHTLFRRFAREAGEGRGGWSLHRVTMPEALRQGLLEKINRASGRNFTAADFLADCRLRARLPEVFEQEYLCRPAGGIDALVPGVALARCQADYKAARLHLEARQISGLFGEYDPARAAARAHHIRQYLRQEMPELFAIRRPCRLGFDVAASGTGDLAVYYIDTDQGTRLRLAGLLTCRTQDWHFLGAALDLFLEELPGVLACGDETGLGRQICWEAVQRHPGVFQAVNFAREKHRLGFLLMNQLSAGAKQFPAGEPDIAADYSALRKIYRGSRWTFCESENPLNAASHCDIAWASALASRAANNESPIQAFVV